VSVDGLTNMSELFSDSPEAADQGCMATFNKFSNIFDRLSVSNLVEILEFLNAGDGDAYMLHTVMSVCTGLHELVLAPQARRLWSNILFSVEDGAELVGPKGTRKMARNIHLARSKNMFMSACQHLELKMVTVFCHVSNLADVVGGLLLNKDYVETINIDIRIDDVAKIVPAQFMAQMNHVLTARKFSGASCEFPKLRSLSVTCVPTNKQSHRENPASDLFHSIVYDVQLMLLGVFGSSIQILSLSPCADRFLRCEKRTFSPSSQLADAEQLSRLCPVLTCLELYSRMQLIACNRLTTTSRHIFEAGADEDILHVATNNFLHLKRFRYVNTSSAEETEDMEVALIQQGNWGRSPSQSLDDPEYHDTSMTIVRQESSGSSETPAEEDDTKLQMANLCDIEIEDNWSSTAANAETVNLIPRSVQSIVMCSDMTEHVTQTLQSFSQSTDAEDFLSVPNGQQFPSVSDEVLISHNNETRARSSSRTPCSKFANLRSLELRDVCFVPIDERVYLNSIGEELTHFLSMCPEVTSVCLPAMRIESPVLRHLQQTHHMSISGTYEDSSIQLFSAAASCC
jgi:hypothetical protein